MKQTIRLFLLLEGVSFALAALIHAGVLVGGYEHGGATTAEGVIGAVLLAGFGLTWPLPGRTRAIGIGAQGFALLGTTVGTYLSLIGVGPHTVPDVVYHATIWTVLAVGLVVAVRASADRAGATA
jgi:hypothetical protein